MSFLTSLNPKQQQAVQITEGPLLIIAGPGSGKTKVLTYRAAYLIKEKKVRPSQILAVTFTNKAAKEMQERIFGLIKTEFGTTRPAIGTFHHIASQILRREIKKIGFSSNFVIFDEDDSVALVKKLLKEIDINPDQFKPTTILNAISWAKTELIDSEAYVSMAESYFQEKVSKIYTRYQESLKKANGLDFDDLINHLVFIFQNYPESLSLWQERFRYIMIDEYQDTSHNQYQLIKLLASKYQNLCAVGDVDQGIYSWRGADFRNILNFEKDWQNAKIIFLEQNYRSTQTILDAAHELISKNISRREKKLWTDKGKGEILICYKAEDEKDEAQFVTQEIKRLMNQSKDNDKKSSAPLLQKELSSFIGYKDFAVLYRINAQSRALEEAFLKASIPYKIVGSVRFYQRKEIKDLIAYLRVIQNPNDLISWERIANVPARGIGPVTWGKIIKCKAKTGSELTQVFKRFISKDQSNKLSQRARSGIFQLSKTYELLHQKSRELSVTRIIKLIIKEINYEEHLKNELQSEDRLENILEFLTVAQKFDKLPPSQGITKLLEEVTLASETDQVETNKNLVNLMTLHSAKGLEFKVVFITGLEEGLLPHRQSQFTPEQLEEERRLCYVGITRAKEKVYLIFTQKRNFGGMTQANPPSRFLTEIPEYLIEFK